MVDIRLIELIHGVSLDKLYSFPIPLKNESESICQHQDKTPKSTPSLIEVENTTKKVCFFSEGEILNISFRL